jgi:dUTP pyrophosphatase
MLIMAKKPTKESVDLGVLEMSTPVCDSGLGTYGWVNIDTYGCAIATQSLSFWQARGKEIPEYATEFAAGFDFRADLEAGDHVAYYDHRNIKHDKTVRGDSESKGRLYIEPGERVLVPTGLYADIPEYTYVAIHARSGTSWKQGLILTNGVGVVDADYVEEIKVSLTNNSGTRVYIEDGERIAQGLLMPTTKAPIKSINGKPAQKTSRAGGFGSTGAK